MTAIAIATMVTSILAVIGVAKSPENVRVDWKDVLFFTGTFGLTWSIAYLFGA
jgi:hypothetical protein